MTVDAPLAPARPTVMGRRYMVAAGHYLAAHAGFDILEAGGNAIDAGVGAAIALAVVESQLVNVAGVAPMILYLAEADEVVAISGLGTWPGALDAERFVRDHQGHVPQGILRTVVPAAPDAWITALERYGTMGFGDVAGAAIRFAGEGFVMYPLMAEQIAAHTEDLRRWPGNAEVYLPGGRPPAVGEPFVQADLARTLGYMADQEKAAARRGRDAGLGAARHAFYRGDIARAIVAYHREHGGLLDADDMADFSVDVEAPLRATFGDTEILVCGPWCQGPVLAQALSLLDDTDLAGLGHNRPAYVHRVVEALKLAFADRHRYYGDPRFVDVPLAELLSPQYARARRRLIDPQRAWPGMPPAGEPRSPAASAPAAVPVATGDAAPGASLDTSYVCAVDGAGNVFSATPSDVCFDTPLIPGTGLCVSSRGSQSWADPALPAGVAPGKRPRLTPNPALAMRRGEFVMGLGTPGGDVQAQAMAQVLLNVLIFGMDPQTAVEAPRFATYSFPDSFEPHETMPDRVQLEGRIAAETGATLAGLGHDVHWWPERTWRAGGVCTIRRDSRSGVLMGGADPRRNGYALGW